MIQLPLLAEMRVVSELEPSDPHCKSDNSLPKAPILTGIPVTTFPYKFHPSSVPTFTERATSHFTAKLTKVRNVTPSHACTPETDGLAGLVVVLCFNILLFIGAKYYYIRRNKYRDGIWDNMTLEEKSHYLDTTKDEGNKRLDFRFAH